MTSQRKNRVGPAMGLLVVALLLAAAPVAWAQDNKGKISRNFYRLPYPDGTSVVPTNDYANHGGGYDTRAQTQGPPFVWAPADGTIRTVGDGSNDCGCNSNAFGGCGNTVDINHDNGEWSRQLHIAQGSATALGITQVGQQVLQGQAVATEGDVGFTCGGSGESAPRAGTCAPSVPQGTGNCLRHIHWTFRRNGTNELVVPMICNVPGNIIYQGQTYTAGDCGNTVSCPVSQNASGQTFSGLNTFKVYQAANTIQASTIVVQNNAGVVMHAGNSVKMTPGFRAAAGGYFRAEIGACNTTAPLPTQP